MEVKFESGFSLDSSNDNRRFIGEVGRFHLKRNSNNTDGGFLFFRNANKNSNILNMIFDKAFGAVNRIYPNT